MKPRFTTQIAGRTLALDDADFCGYTNSSSLAQAFDATKKIEMHGFGLPVRPRGWGRAEYTGYYISLKQYTTHNDTSQARIRRFSKSLDLFKTMWISKIFSEKI